MTLGIDTDVLVSWVMRGTARHAAARRLFAQEVEAGGRLGLTPQVLWELVHVVSDPRRFERPLAMPEALRRVRELWDAPEVARLVAGARVVPRALELMERLRLGRKSILDTVLAVTLEASDVSRLATWNGRDFERFHFLEVVTPE